MPSTTGDFPLPAGKDAQYLAETVGDTLAAALARVAVVQPSDPVDWLGRLILSEAEAQKRREARAKEKALLAEQGKSFRQESLERELESCRRESGKWARNAERYVHRILTDRRARIAASMRESAARAALAAQGKGGKKRSGAGDDEDVDDEATEDEDEEDRLRREKAEAAALAQAVAATPEPDEADVSRALLVSIAADLARSAEGTPAVTPAIMPGEPLDMPVVGPAAAAAAAAAASSTTSSSNGGVVATPRDTPVTAAPAWLRRLEDGSHDPAAAIKARAAAEEDVLAAVAAARDGEIVARSPEEEGAAALERAKMVDESHALFRVVRAFLLLLGYPAASIPAWPQVVQVLREPFFLKQFELHALGAVGTGNTNTNATTGAGGDAAATNTNANTNANTNTAAAQQEEALLAKRLTQCCEAIAGVDLAQLHGSPLVGTVLLEYVKEAARLAGLVTKGRVNAQVQGSEGETAVGKGFVQASVEVAPEITARGAQPEAGSGLDLHPLPGLNSCVIESATAAQAPLQFRVTWDYIPEPLPPAPPVDESKSADRDGEDSDEASGSDSEEDDRRSSSRKKGSSKKGKSGSKKDKKSSKSSKRPSSGKRRSRRAADSSDDEDDDFGDDDDEDGDGAAAGPRWEPEVDLSCLVLDAAGNVVDTIYFDQPSSRDGSVSVTENGKLLRASAQKTTTRKGRRGKAGGKAEEAVDTTPANTEVVTVDLARLPPTAHSFALGLGCLVPGEDLAHVRGVSISIAHKQQQQQATDVNAAGGGGAVVPTNVPELARLSFPVARAHDAVLCCLVHRMDEDPSSWCLRAVADPVPTAAAAAAAAADGSGSTAARTPLRVVPSVLAYLDTFGVGAYDGAARDAAARVHGRLAMSPGDAFEVPAEDLVIAVGWTPASSAKPVEVECAVSLFEGTDYVEAVSADSTQSTDGAFNHGSNQASAVAGDAESVAVSLPSIDKGTTAAMVSIAVPDDEQSLLDISGAYVRLVDAETRKEFARLSVDPRALAHAMADAAAAQRRKQRGNDGDGDDDNEDDGPRASDAGCVVLAKLHRSSKRSWEFVAVGEATDARSAGDADTLEAFARASWSRARVLTCHGGDAGAACHALVQDGYSLSLSAVTTGRVAPIDLGVAIFGDGLQAIDAVGAARLKSADRGVVHQGDDAEALLPGEVARVQVNLNKVAERTEAMCIVATIGGGAADKDGKDAGGGGKGAQRQPSSSGAAAAAAAASASHSGSGSIGGGGGADDAAATHPWQYVEEIVLALWEEETQRRVAEVRVRPCDLVPGVALALAKVHRIAPGAGGWSLSAVEESLPGAKDATPEESGAAALQAGLMRPGWVPGRRLTRGEPCVSRRRKTTFGFGWNAPAARKIDVDAGAWLMRGAEMVETVTYRTQVSSDGAVVHAGDNRGEDPIGTGASQDRERIRIDFGDLRADVDTVVLYLHVYDDEHSFLDIDRAHVRAFDEASGQEIASFAVAADTRKTNARIMLKVQWRGDAWVMVPVGDTQKHPDPEDVRLAAILRSTWPDAK